MEVKRGRGRPVIDLTGQKFGMLTVLGRHRKVKATWAGSRLRYETWSWSCRCDCGKECSRYLKDLRRPNAKHHCGCQIQKENNEKGLPGHRIAWSMLMAHCTEAGRELTLTFHEFASLISQNCYYCGSPPVLKKSSRQTLTKRGKPRKIHEWLANGVDRVDNQFGYILGNCVPCCTICNRAKGETGQREFLIWANKVSNHSVIRIAAA